MKTYFVSIITLNYNGKGYLKSFLESALDLHYPKNAYEIIVVDNASTDGSVDYIKKNFSKVRIIKSKKNLGFGRGNNLGMKDAKGDLFFLVKPLSGGFFNLILYLCNRAAKPLNNAHRVYEVVYNALY